MRYIDKDQESLDTYHASTLYLKLFKTFYTQGILANTVEGLVLETPIAGFEKEVTVVSGDDEAAMEG